jgi:predicted enzyme related to lactoylglutathione lyase
MPMALPYWLVDDIDIAIKSAREVSGELAHPPRLIPARGTFAIYVHGGVQFGLWQL